MGTTGTSMVRSAVRVTDLAAEERGEGRIGWASSIVARREPDALNDAVVTLHVRAEVRACLDGSVASWTARSGYVWAVCGDQAIVDFGSALDGAELVVFARVDDLVVHVVDAYEEAA